MEGPLDQYPILFGDPCSSEADCVEAPQGRAIPSGEGIRGDITAQHAVGSDEREVTDPSELMGRGVSSKLDMISDLHMSSDADVVG